MPLDDVGPSILNLGKKFTLCSVIGVLPANAAILFMYAYSDLFVDRSTIAVADKKARQGNPLVPR